MKRSGAVKFPHSVQLFKFCQKVMMHQKGVKVRDQEVGSILNFNPSDCSHWKRGEKNVRSVFALAKLAEALSVETTLIHDITSGSADLDEAFFEYQESRSYRTLKEQVHSASSDKIQKVRQQVLDFVAQIQQEADLQTAPLYLPEVMRSFAFITTQPVEMLDKLSRILRVKAGQYCIQYKKGELKAQTRMSMVKDLARIIFEGERDRFPEFGSPVGSLAAYEQQLFVANLLLPRNLILQEMSKMDSRKNVISELATIFWVPKSLVSFQLQDMVTDNQTVARQAEINKATMPTAQIA